MWSTVVEWKICWRRHGPLHTRLERWGAAGRSHVGLISQRDRCHIRVADIESALMRNRRQGWTSERGDRWCEGPLFVPHQLCTAADQAHRAFASRGLCGVTAAFNGLRWTVRLALNGGHRCVDRADGRQQTLWIADPQHPGDCVSGYYCPAYAGAGAADGDPVQRRKPLGSKEIQAAQIKDQPAATQHMPQRVLGQNVSVGCVDAAMGPYNNYRGPEPTTG